MKWEPDRNYRADPLPRARAVRIKCIDCCGNSAHEARKCRIYSCPIWPWGMAAQAVSRSAKAALKVGVDALNAKFETAPRGEVTQ